MPKIPFSSGFDPPPPKWEYEPVPDFKKFDHPQAKADEYWEEQNRRWIEGHAGLTGAHYFYLQECYLNDIDGNVFRPEWRDVDELMFRWVEDAMRDEQSLLIYKRREIGATSVFANLPFWFMRVFPGATSGLTSGKGGEGIRSMFNDKILFSYNRFNKSVLNTVPVQINNTKQRQSLTVGLKVWSDVLQGMDLRTSELYCKETDEKPDSPTNLSGRRYKYVYVDEAPLHRRIEDFLGSIFPAISKQTMRTGLLVMAGTVEPQLTQEEVMRFYNLIQRSSNLNIRTEMLPVWLGLVTKNGWSDEQAGMEWYYQNVGNFEKTGDLKGLRDFRMQYPKDEDDLFDLAQGGVFEDDVADLLNEHYKELCKGKNEELAYKLVKSAEGIKAIPDSKVRKPEQDGGHWILEPPKQNVMYYQAIDGIGTGKKEGAESGSWIGCTIYKGYDPDGGSYSPVAHYFERPNTVEEGYRQIVNQWHFYNKYDGGKEINYETAAATGDHFGTFLSKEGLYRYAAPRRDLSGRGHIDTKKRGTAVNDHTREWQIRQANVFLRKYGTNIRSRLLLQSLLKSSEENADLRDAFFVFLVSIPNFDKPIEKKKPKPPRTKVGIKRMADGTWQYETTVVQGNEPMEHLDGIDRYIAQLKHKYGDYWYVRSTADEKAKYNELKNDKLKG